METAMTIDMNPLKATLIGKGTPDRSDLNAGYANPATNSLSLGLSAVGAATGADEVIAKGILTPMITGQAEGLGAAVMQITKELGNLGIVGDAMRSVGALWEPSTRTMNALYCNARDFLKGAVERYGIRPISSSEQFLTGALTGLGVTSSIADVVGRTAEVNMLKNVTDPNATNEGGAKWSGVYRLAESIKNLTLPAAGLVLAGPYGFIAGAIAGAIDAKIGWKGAQLADQVAKGYDPEDKESVAKLAKLSSDSWLKTPSWRARFRSALGGIQSVLGIGFSVVALGTGAPVMSLIAGVAGVIGYLELKGQGKAADVYGKMADVVRGEKSRIAVEAKKAQQTEKADDCKPAADKCKDEKAVDKKEEPKKVAQPV